MLSCLALKGGGSISHNERDFPRPCLADPLLCQIPLLEILLYDGSGPNGVIIQNAIAEVRIGLALFLFVLVSKLCLLKTSSADIKSGIFGVCN